MHRIFVMLRLSLTPHPEISHLHTNRRIGTWDISVGSYRLTQFVLGSVFRVPDRRMYRRQRLLPPPDRL